MPPYRNRPHRSGLEAFLPELQDEAHALPDARLLDLDQIDANPLQPRQAFDAQALAELSISIREHGVLQPIIVRPQGDRYQVVVGERRLRAARLAGETTIPALVRDLSDTDAAYATATENLQRADLDIEDAARQFAHLLAVTGLSERALAERLGIGYNYISRRVRLLQRPALFAEIRAGRLTLHDAMDLLSPDVPLASDPPPDLTERAALAAPGVSGGHRQQAASFVPYRWRALESAYKTLRSMDFEQAPPTERPRVLARIRELQSYLTAWEARLTSDAPPADPPPDPLRQ